MFKNAVAAIGLQPQEQYYFDSTLLRTMQPGTGQVQPIPGVQIP